MVSFVTSHRMMLQARSKNEEVSLLCFECDADNIKDICIQQFTSLWQFWIYTYIKGLIWNYNIVMAAY